MRHRRRGRVAGALAASAVLVLATGNAHASAAPTAFPPTFPPTGVHMTPSSGPAGTHVTVTGTCGNAGKVPWFFGVPNSNGGPNPMRGEAPAGLTGNFTIEFEVTPSDPKLSYVVGLYCAVAEPDPSTPIQFTQLPFKLTAAAPSLPKATIPSTPSAPVDAKPNFTG